MILALFLARLGRNRSRKKKKNSFRSVPTRPRIEHSQKNSKKIKKIKKHHSGFISSQTESGKVEKEKKKFILICSYSNWARAFPKK